MCTAHGNNASDFIQYYSRVRSVVEHICSLIQKSCPGPKFIPGVLDNYEFFSMHPTLRVARSFPNALGSLSSLHKEIPESYLKRKKPVGAF